MLKLTILFFILLAGQAGNSFPKYSSRSNVPGAFPITSENISFNLIPHEPGPSWVCSHVSVPNLPYDWRVTCESQVSKAKFSFLIHFLVRVYGQNQDLLEVLYWVDEYPSTLRGTLPISHGQSTLIGFQNGMMPNRMSLGQFVQNGTSSLNILYSASRLKTYVR